MPVSLFAFLHFSVKFILIYVSCVYTCVHVIFIQPTLCIMYRTSFIHQSCLTCLAKCVNFENYSKHLLYSS